jgi:uncharacterized protein YndB with AHSA1/START domain
VTVSEIDSVVCETTIAAEPETVFAFFTDAALYTQWMGARAHLEPRPGGTYAVEINDQARARGTFVELVPHSRIVFTFGWEGDDQPVPPGSSSVEVTLSPIAEGTHVRLVHRGLRQIQVRNEHRDGWQLYLARLSALASGNAPGRDPNANPPQEP